VGGAVGIHDVGAGPPASTTPAAMSHGWFNMVMLASSFASASHARSIAADPSIRTRSARLASCLATSSRSWFRSSQDAPTAKSPIATTASRSGRAGPSRRRRSPAYAPPPSVP
jgi:hypothetical protein